MPSIGVQSIPSVSTLHSRTTVHWRLFEAYDPRGFGVLFGWNRCGVECQEAVLLVCLLLHSGPFGDGDIGGEVESRWADTEEQDEDEKDDS